MTLSKKTPSKKERYDWTLIVEAAMQSPGEWICEDDEQRPSTNGYQIRRGTPEYFNPPGSFDAIYRKDGTYVRYVGVPLVPWVDYEDERRFDEIERTFDPDSFPEGTPQGIIDRAELHTPKKVLKNARKAHRLDS